jgi:hypothetical protein
MLANVVEAHASSHGAMPQGLSLWQMVVFQATDFATHVSLALDGVRLMLVSPSLGWTMLDGALCGDKTHLAHFVFDSATHALETLAALALLALLAAVEAVMLLRRFVRLLAQSRVWRFA